MAESEKVPPQEAEEDKHHENCDHITSGGNLHCDWGVWRPGVDKITDPRESVEQMAAAVLRDNNSDGLVSQKRAHMLAKIVLEQKNTIRILTEHAEHRARLLHAKTNLILAGEE